MRHSYFIRSVVHACLQHLFLLTKIHSFPSRMISSRVWLHDKLNWFIRQWSSPIKNYYRLMINFQPSIKKKSKTTNWPKFLLKYCSRASVIEPQNCFLINHDIASEFYWQWKHRSWYENLHKTEMHILITCCEMCGGSVRWELHCKTYMWS